MELKIKKDHIVTSLNNKIVFISGASSGIGAACAEAFAALGARLILCARRLPHLEKITADLREKYNSPIHIFQLDVTDRDAVAAAINNLPTDWQAIDILINNAGLAAGFAGVQNGDIDDWERMIDTNIKGLLYLTRAIIPGMITRNQGHIINIGSTAGHEVYPNGAVYCATKYAVRAINLGLKHDLLGTNIRVSSVDPGMVDTEFSIVRFAGDQQKAAAVYQGLTPLTANDVADAIIYCASRPAHVNIREIVLLPVDQASATRVHRRN